MPTPNATEEEKLKLFALGEFLEKRRKEKKLTISEMMRQSGLTRGTVAGMFDGRYNPTFSTLLKMTKVLDIEMTFNKKDLNL